MYKSTRLILLFLSFNSFISTFSSDSSTNSFKSKKAGAGTSHAALHSNLARSKERIMSAGHSRSSLMQQILTGQTQISSKYEQQIAITNQILSKVTSLAAQDQSMHSLLQDSKEREFMQKNRADRLTSFFYGVGLGIFGGALTGAYIVATNPRLSAAISKKALGE